MTKPRTLTDTEMRKLGFKKRFKRWIYERGNYSFPLPLDGNPRPKDLADILFDAGARYGIHFARIKMQEICDFFERDKDTNR